MIWARTESVNMTQLKELNDKLIELKCYLSKHEFPDELKCRCGEKQTIIVKYMTAVTPMITLKATGI